MQQKLLSEFPSVTYEAWRAQVERDLKGADFEKRLLTRTLEGIVVQPLYTARDVTELAKTQGQRLPTPQHSGGIRDLRAEQASPDLALARQEISADLLGGATSLWLRFESHARTGVSAEAAQAGVDGLVCDSATQLAGLLADVDLSKTPVALDGGGNAAVSALLLAAVTQAGALRGTLGFDPLGALARDGVLPYDLNTARELCVGLCRLTANDHPQLTAAQVATDSYHLAGANGVQELAYALATGTEYLRWLLEAGLTVDQASAQIGFRMQVASDMFLELAKLRALRLTWAKIIAAHGGNDSAQTTTVHAVTSQRTKTRRDPWVNMLRTTTEAFAALVGGADAVTTSGFDAALGHSDDFARRIARNVQVILTEEAHVTQVLDAAGGSYYVESLTDQLARAGWSLFQSIESRGGMSSALSSGSVAQEIAETAKQRAQAIAKRQVSILGVSEFANLTEEPVRRSAGTRATTGPSAVADSVVQAVETAKGGERIGAAITAARAGATLVQLTAALAVGTTPARTAALPVRHSADAYQALRDRSDEHAKQTGQPPRVFLCNLGEIPKHKARASFATGFCGAGGVGVVDNEGFASVPEAVAAFAAAKTDTVIICGSDEQYPEWVPQLTAALRESGAKHMLLAGRPGDNQASYEQAGISTFIYMGVDVVALLGQLLDSMGVAA